MGILKLCQDASTGMSLLHGSTSQNFKLPITKCIFELLKNKNLNFFNLSIKNLKFDTPNKFSYISN